MQPEARIRSRVRIYMADHLPPGYRWSAVEHGRKHGGTPQQRAAEWARLKAQGVAVGLMDGFLLGPDRLFLWLELKAGKNDLSDAQEGWRDFVIGCGFRWLLVRTVCGLHNELVAAGVPVGRRAALDAERHDDALLIPEPVKKVAARKPARPRVTARGLAMANKVYGL